MSFREEIASMLRGLRELLNQVLVGLLGFTLLLFFVILPALRAFTF